MFVEANLDGLVGPTHLYGGLSPGNFASEAYASQISQPRLAALQGLDKMRLLHEMGIPQLVLPPHHRPNYTYLQDLGFCGSRYEMLKEALTMAPHLLARACSAANMWTANAATVSPSADTSNNKVHFTPANLTNKFHRSLEPEVTGRILQATFADEAHFEHHAHLPDNEHFGDEGAANHTRLCSDYGQAGVEIFVYGRHAFDSTKPAPQKYPARQTLEACQAIARLHGLSEERTVYVQQNPDVIDQGVFHNDVISVGNQNVLFYHQEAFQDTSSSLDEIQTKFGEDKVHFIRVDTDVVPVQEAIKTYLFNTQIITLPDGKMAIVAPTDCQESPIVSAYLDDLVTQNTPIQKVHYFDVKQSMRNGGGPACLRLRVAMTGQELAAVNQNTLMSDAVFERLNQWVDKHYRDELAVDDLRDVALLNESQAALDELTQILKLGSVYPFQR